jgi:hypothetical protein
MFPWLRRLGGHMVLGIICLSPISKLSERLDFLGRAEQFGADSPTDKAGDETFGRVSRRERRVQAPRIL